MTRFNRIPPVYPVSVFFEKKRPYYGSCPISDTSHRQTLKRGQMFIRRSAFSGTYQAKHARRRAEGSAEDITSLATASTAMHREGATSPRATEGALQERSSTEANANPHWGRNIPGLIRRFFITYLLEKVLLPQYIIFKTYPTFQAKKTEPDIGSGESFPARASCNGTRGKYREKASKKITPT